MRPQIRIRPADAADACRVSDAGQYALASAGSTDDVVVKQPANNNAGTAWGPLLSSAAGGPEERGLVTVAVAQMPLSLS